MRLKDKYGTPMTIALVFSFIVIIFNFLISFGFLRSLCLGALVTFLVLIWINNSSRDDQKKEINNSKKINIIKLQEFQSYFIGGAIVSLVLLFLLSI